MHNAIWPGPSIAALAADVAMTVMGTARPGAASSVDAGTPVALGAVAGVEIDAAGCAVRIIATAPVLLSGRADGAAIQSVIAIAANGNIRFYGGKP